MLMSLFARKKNRVQRLLRERFNLKNSVFFRRYQASCQKPSKNFGWFLHECKNYFRKKIYQIPILFIVVVIFLVGVNFADLAKWVVGALNQDLVSVRLYPSQSQAENKSYNQGWWGQNKAMGEPQNGPKDGLLNFSDRNAAFYSGGDYSLVLSGFSVLPFAKHNSLNKESIFTPTSTKSRVATGTDSRRKFIDNSNILNINKEASGTSELLGKQKLNDSEATSSAEYINDYRENILQDTKPMVEIRKTTDFNQNTVDVLLNEKESQINAIGVKEIKPTENFGVEVAPQSIDADINKDKETIETHNILEQKKKTVSVLSGHRLFGSAQAQAQEYLDEKIKSASDLGEFKEASIHFSLAGALLGSVITNKGTSTDKNEIPESGNSKKVKLDTREIFNNQGSSTKDSFMNKTINKNISTSSTVTSNPDSGAGGINSLDVNSEETNSKPIEVEIKETEAREKIKILDLEEMFTSGDAEDDGDVIDDTDKETNIDPVSRLFGIKAVMASNSFDKQAKIIVWYSLDTNSASSSEIWQKLTIINADRFSNALNDGYFSFDAPFLHSWQDAAGLKIKFSGVWQGEEKFSAYLDSVWVEAKYIPQDKVNKIRKRPRWETALDLLSYQTVFNINEGGVLEFQYTKNKEKIWDSLQELVGAGDYWRNVDIQVDLLDSTNNIVKENLVLVMEDNGKFKVNIPGKQRSMRPGKYTLLFNIKDSSGEETEDFSLRQNFYRGIVAFNTDKDIYRPGDRSFLQLGVLDNNGRTLCDANVEIKITGPKGDEDIISTDNGKIKISPACSPKSVTNNPDYSAIYVLQNIGIYNFYIKVETGGEVKTVHTSVKVGADPAVQVERQVATRINPKADYKASAVITVRKAFNGQISEFLPSKFKINNIVMRILYSTSTDPFGPNYAFKEEIVGETKKLIWNDIEIPAGGSLEISYTFDAPDISPELFLLGPMKINDFQEQRQWQIASDAINKRARTVMFLGGTYSGDGSTGENTNVDNSFSTFNFKLAETGVDIKSAFVLFEAQIEAYNSTGGDYTGYKLYFDSCVESCTANAITGTGRVLEDDSNILAYDEVESNQIRLLFDVTNESQLATYTGAGENMQAQIAYQIKNATTKNSIANAKAVLYLTYVYDIDSPNVTNTVVYPLDSTVTGDSGSLQVHQEGDCTFGTDCPGFSYNMAIPEYPTSMTSARLANWFRFYEVNDNHGSVDVQTSMEISGQTTPSATFIHEATNAGTQGNIPAMYFASLVGFSENTDQTVEYRSYTNSATNDHAIEGGEIFETYIASSSAATSTRTVSFPIGVINNGSTTSLTSGETKVYFPENGTASGTVKIKKVWLRIISHEPTSGARTIQVSTKVGSNATSSTYTYNYNVGGSVIKPAFTVIHIIPSSPTNDYAALEEANLNNPVTVKVNTQNNNVDVSGTAVELMITYTYTSEDKGYLSSLKLFAGQSNTNPGTSTILGTANSVFPENGIKNIYAAGLWASYLNSDNLGDVGAGTVFLLDANLSTSSSPVCTPAYRAEPDDINSFTEFYKNVTSSMDTTDNQAYYACYADDESLTTSDGARMNGILEYTYGWQNNAPTSTIISALQRIDGTDVIDLSVALGDIDGQDTRAKLEYATGTSCNFSSSGDPTIDETDNNITATYGDPDADNSLTYQLGTPDAYIQTASGTNIVDFDWLAKTDLKNLEGYYCLRLTANDRLLDQSIPATSTVYIDTLSPTVPGALSLNSRSGVAITLNFGATTTETNFNEYKIFYKMYDGSNPMESDDAWSSSSDANLGNILFNSVATTSISGLTPKTTYSFAIWAYDNYGNKASSSRVDIKTNDAPSTVFSSATQKNDGTGIVDVSFIADDNNNDDTLRAKLEYVLGADCNFSSSNDPTLDTVNVSADFGLPVIDNNQIYQIGSSSGYIITSPGANTINFDWLGATDEPSANATYCLRLMANDGLDDQISLATTTLVLDNVVPVSTGDLTSGAVTTDSIVLVFATSSPGQDTNEPSTNAYKVFYKQGTSGVSESDNEKDLTALDSYDYNGATSTIVNGLDQNTWYVFNIWTYDSFGNKTAATEIAVKTNATISNDSLTFVNPGTSGTSSNIAVADASSIWTFRAVVTETNGWYAIASTTIKLADSSDNTSPFDDLIFYWDQTANQFYESGTDDQSAATLSQTSTSTCTNNTCTLDFNIIFNKSFLNTNSNYNVELYSGNDSGTIDMDSFNDFYQIRFPYIKQTHYRWRNDDGGE